MLTLQSSKSVSWKTCAYCMVNCADFEFEPVRIQIRRVQLIRCLRNNKCNK